MARRKSGLAKRAPYSICMSRGAATGWSAPLGAFSGPTGSDEELTSSEVDFTPQVALAFLPGTAVVIVGAVASSDSNSNSRSSQSL